MVLRGKMRIASTVAIGITACLALQAQDRGGPGRGRPAPNVGFTALDLNADGELDAREIIAAPGSLAKLDRNFDGQITSDEIRTAMPHGRGPGGRGEGRGEGRGGGGQEAGDGVDEAVDTLMSFDANGDGKLSRSELPERFQGIFDRADENKDGFVTRDELRKTIAAQAPPPEPNRPGGRGGGPGGGRGPMNFIRMDPVLAAVDSNGDGIISAEEIRNSSEALRKLDTNGDGKITREEASVGREDQ
jgi:Ca2+-binding EF-hand superfamily protein